MSGGITDASTPKRLPFYEAVAQGATAAELRQSLSDIPDEAYVVFVDSYDEGEQSFFQNPPRITAGIGFRWTVDV